MNKIVKAIKYIQHPVQGIKLHGILRELKKNIDENVTDAFMHLLLEGMSLIFIFDCSFRKNIAGFNAKYAFKDKSGGVSTGAVFKNEHMTVTDKAMSDFTIEVVFKNPKALRDFLFSSDPDIINALLENNITTQGNLNYILKFGYLAKHLQLAFL
jgi:hypothetical protein